LLRFYAPDAGEISLDDLIIDEYRLRDYRRQFAVVSQTVELFSDTVRNNIAFGSLSDASYDDVIDAARRAHAMEFIERLPAGLDTVLGDQGAGLSGGQRQRLAIARALLKRAPVLILDEATSALDGESERAVQAALEDSADQRTTLVIAHRLSTIENADRIILLDQGQILAQGSHQELLSTSALYASMYRQGTTEG